MKILTQSVFDKWEIEDKSVQAIITSPPYFSLRKYSIPDVVIGGDRDCKHEWGEYQIIEKQHHGKVLATLKDNAKISSSSSSCLHCHAWQGQHGLEPSFKLYLEHCKLWMQEAIRVLKDDGVIFINLADSYAGSNQGRGTKVMSKKQSSNTGTQWMCGESIRRGVDEGVTSKSKLLIPERFAIMMADYDGEDIYKFKEDLTMDERFAILNEIAKYQGNK